VQRRRANSPASQSTHWYHPLCAAFRRPEAFLHLEGSAETLPGRSEALVTAAAFGVAHHRVPRIDRATPGAAQGTTTVCGAVAALAPQGFTATTFIVYEPGPT